MTLNETAFMVDFVDSFGKYAGKIWAAFNTNGSLTENKLMEKTGLTEKELYSAIGWLAKENKIYKRESNFSLGDTNLTAKIGNDAGMVFKILDMWGEVDVESISRLAKINENDVFCAAGWLMREGKLDGKTIKNDTNNFLFWLK
jgi:hypothetical protein